MAQANKIKSRIKRKARVRARVVGTSVKPRLSVYRSNAHIYAQLIDDSAGKVLCAASDNKATGTKSEKAKSTGVAIAKLALKAKIETVVFDRNGYKYHGRVKMVADGAREGGLNF